MGQNAFVSEAAPIPLLKVDPAIEREQTDQVRQWRAARDGRRASEALTSIERAAQGEDNLIGHKIIRKL